MLLVYLDRGDAYGLLARAAEWLRGLGKPIYLTEE